MVEVVLEEFRLAERNTQLSFGQAELTVATSLGTSSA